jgi:xanthine dehydrogenase small subunit
VHDVQNNRLKQSEAGSGKNAIRLLINDKLVSITDVEPSLNLLSYLRNYLRLNGSKEGCAEGDCGACTVVIGELVNGSLRLKAINSCIQWLSALDGKAVFTVEYLRQADNSLHPAQQAMVESHGSQCGFCTPGFVMSLWQIYNEHTTSGTTVTERQLRYGLSGNLCRCTGYKPIIEAGLNMFDLPTVEFDPTVTIQRLKNIQRPQSFVYECQQHLFQAPKTVEELTQLRESRPNATILAGCTDIGLWVNKQYKAIDDIIYIGQVAELGNITLHDSGLRIGAGVNLTDAYDAIESLYPQLQQMHERFASVPVRNAGTLGGNIVNGSPIGDSMPWLIALGASVVCANSCATRQLPLDTFYLDYMQNALSQDEVLLSIEIPLPVHNQLFRTYKVSKRFDSDISAVCAAFNITLKDNSINDAVVAFGGMAAIPKRAQRCETALIGNQWNQSTIDSAKHALQQDYTPLSDMRASASNRQQVAQNLLQRFFLDMQMTTSSKSLNTTVFENDS